MVYRGIGLLAITDYQPASTCAGRGLALQNLNQSARKVIRSIATRQTWKQCWGGPVTYRPRWANEVRPRSVSPRSGRRHKARGERSEPREHGINRCASLRSGRRPAREFIPGLPAATRALISWYRFTRGSLLTPGFMPSSASRTAYLLGLLLQALTMRQVCHCSGLAFSALHSNIPLHLSRVDCAQ